MLNIKNKNKNKKTNPKRYKFYYIINKTFPTLILASAITTIAASIFKKLPYACSSVTEFFMSIIVVAILVLYGKSIGERYTKLGLLDDEEEKIDKSDKRSKTNKKTENAPKHKSSDIKKEK